MRETLGFLEMFGIFIWVLVETKGKTLWKASLHGRDLLCSYLSLSLDLFLGTQDYTPDLISGLKFEMAQVE